MNRDAKILSAIAVAILGAALGLMVYVNAPGGGVAASDDTGDASAPLTIKNANAPTAAAGKLAIDFKLKDLRGKTISLSSLRGKVVFLNIWATWCGPCREEMPSIENLYEKLGGDRDFVILAVSQDTDGGAAVAPYMRTNGFKFDALLDPDNEVGEAYDVSGIPETFIIDRNGRIVAHHLGPYDWSNPEIRDALRELLNSKTG
ncbi:MAG: TlpA family protein disulfide reductase [Candidatus Binataceae bacterium]|nr:TlpA family protein disulfide reductase [Candidatus Binataceae bacterium]